MLIFIIFFAVLFLLIYVHFLIKKSNVNFNFIYLNYFMLISFLVLIIAFNIPAVAHFITMIGFLPRDFLFFLGIGYLFYASFIQSVIIAQQASKLNKIIAKLSVKEAIQNNDIYKE